MSHEEIRSEIHKDFPIVWRKAHYLARDAKKAYGPLKDKAFVKVFHYLSKQKNTWIIKADMDKQGNRFSFLVYYYNTNGLCAIEVFLNATNMMYFTTHFFKRYNERLALNCKTPAELLNIFMLNHNAYMVQPLEQISPGIFKMFAKTEKGIVLGTLLQNEKMIKMNTFITHTMLQGSQLDIEASLKVQLDKYLATIHRLD